MYKIKLIIINLHEIKMLTAAVNVSYSINYFQHFIIFYGEF